MNPWEILINELTGKWGWLLIISTIACLGFVGMALSQFIQCLWTKNTTSFNKWFIIVLPVTNTLITIYDLILFSIFLMNNDFMWSFLLPAVLNGLVSAYGVMILKIKHMWAARKHNMTEMQYYEKYLKPKSLATKHKNKKK